MSTVTTRMWSFRYWLPGVAGDMGERRYGKNATVTVLCDTLEDAHGLFRARLPDAVIWSITHKGGEEYFYNATNRAHTIILKERVPTAGEKL